MTLNTKDAMRRLDSGLMIDFCLSNGILRSSKSILKASDDHFIIFHDIDGSEVNFTRAGLLEVLNGKRSPWEGDREEWTNKDLKELEVA